MENSCRLCLQAAERLRSIFQFKDGYQIAEVIRTICSIAIDSEDKYSKEICCNCLKSLYIAHDLRVLSIKNDKYLKELDPSDSLFVKIEPKEDFVKYEPSPSPDGDGDDNDGRDYSDNTFDIVEVSIQTATINDRPQVFYQCDRCPKLKTSKQSMEAHIKNEHLSLNVCSLCTKQFSTLAIMKQHINRVHMTEEALTCNQCNVSFKTQIKLNRHQEVHSYYIEEFGEDLRRSFYCRFCTKQFGELSERMFEHIKYHKKISKAKEEQGKQASAKRAREEYESLVCPHCGQIYRTKQILQQHIKRHFDTGDKYQCSKCPQKFKSWGELYYHNAVHTTERNFVCEICSKAFKAKRDLRNHKIRHETKDVKKFQCTYCQLMVKNRYSLSRHILIHTGEVILI